MIRDLEEIGAADAVCDLVVVGCGIAGICGAIEARERGAHVIVLERGSGTIGSSALASGHFYMGGGTGVQEACGFPDSAEATATYLAAVGSDPDKAKVEAFAAGGVELFDWLEARGVPFERSYFPTKAVIQEGTECLIWTGNENVWPYREQAAPAPRGHKVAWQGKEGGGGLAMRGLVAHAESIGVEILYDMQVDTLLTRGGRFAGVGARHFGERRWIESRNGVLLAGGGFGRNAEMMARYLARFDGVTILGGEYDDGGVIRLGEEAGAALEHMGGMLVTSPIYPPEQLIKGILVNREGQRFVAEDSYHTRTSVSITDQPGGEAYLVVDADIFAYPSWYQQANQALVDGFETVPEMEARLAMPEGALVATLEAYNAAAAQGEDPAFHKHPQWLKPLDKGPWAAFDFTWGRAGYNGFTLGGMKIDADGEVLREDGSVIAGLYAAGACASMLATDAYDYASGISLASGAFFGRAAARHALG